MRSLLTLLGKLTATKENLQNCQRVYKERVRERVKERGRERGRERERMRIGFGAP